jgi:hypothetical protein
VDRRLLVELALLAALAMLFTAAGAVLQLAAHGHVAW